MVSTPHKLNKSSSFAIDFLQAAKFFKLSWCDDFAVAFGAINHSGPGGKEQLKVSCKLQPPGKKLGQFPSSLDPLSHPLWPPHSGV